MIPGAKNSSNISKGDTVFHSKTKNVTIHKHSLLRIVHTVVISLNPACNDNESGSDLRYIPVMAETSWCEL